jgi:hypothetical protein
LHLDWFLAIPVVQERVEKRIYVMMEILKATIPHEGEGGYEN